LNAQAAELTDDLQERGLIAPDVVYHTPSQIGGLESVAGAGLWSGALQRIAMTMVERGEASVAGAGLWSARLQRIAMTMDERARAKLAKDPRDKEAAKQRERDRNREEGRKKKCVDMDQAKLAKDEAMIEEQCPGVMQNFALWKVSDGSAMRNRLHYSSGALRTALTDKKVSDYTRPLPQLVHAVKVAYGFRFR